MLFPTFWQVYYFIMHLESVALLVCLTSGQLANKLTSLRSTGTLA